MPNSVEKTMRILRALSDFQNRPQSLAILAEQTQINKSTAAHILKTLCELGYVQKISHNAGYVLGAELHFLTRYGRYGENIIAESHSILERMHRDSGGTAVFAVLRGGKKYIIDRVCTDNIYSDGEASILGDDVYRTVTGRVLLANSEPDVALEVFEALGLPKKCEWENVRNRNDFLRQLSEIRALNCLYTETVQNGVMWRSFSVPIFENKKCVGALGLAKRFETKEKFEDSDFKKLCDMMKKCGKELERRLKFRK